ncbi:aspartyl protease family protein 2 [Humulus lupulus]|uniref:aspartyl protease family protein 2 n=1 Tax=Humulus lupulus TaxID=3486 RepID=UPI002B4027EB|nr:aspartyl protease family protein 2 [Humulus lupulus]
MVSFISLPLLLSATLFLFSAFTDPNIINVCNSKTTHTQDYLKLPLLHRNPFASPAELLSSDAYRLSVLHRRRRHPVVKSPVVSGASTGSGQYFVDLQVGTPPQKLLLVADTGSDLVWLRCSACKNCTHRLPGSAFLARHSATFSPHHCFHSACRLVPHPKPNPCNRTLLHSPCRYDYSYADGSTTSGFFSKETTTLRTSSGKETKVPGLSFGCAFRVSGPEASGGSFDGAQGVMGLGRGPISFSTQLGRRFGNKFSYCLMDYTIAPAPTSYLMFGGLQNDVILKIPKMSFTPLLFNPLSPTFYYIGIKTVFVDGLKLPISPSVWSIDELGNGGTVIDSGTTLTFLAEPAYRLVLAAFKRRVKRPSSAQPNLGFDLCVNVSGVSRLRLPKLSFQLAGNSVEFSPPQSNYFIEAAESVHCLAIQPVELDSGFSVLGNLMQQGFLFEFDKDRSRLGFTRHGCARP